MNKKLLATALLGLGLFPSLLFGQYYRMDIDLQNPGENRVIDRVFTGNTVGLDVGLFDGDVPFSATNWTVWFKYGDGQYATNDMQAIAGVTSSNRVVFNAVSNVFYSPNENYYFSIFGTNGAGRRATFARGRLIEEYDPAASEGIGTSSNGIYYHAVSWEIITGDPADNAALVQYVEDHGGGSAEDTVARAGVESNAASIVAVGAVASNAVLRSIATVPASDAYSAAASESLPFVVTNSGALTLSGLTAGSIGIRLTTTNASGIALYAAVVKDGDGETIATINPACDGTEQSARWPWNASETLTVEATGIASPVEGAESAIVTAAQVETWEDVSLVGKMNDLADQHLYVDYPAATNEAANRAYADDAADAALALALGEITTATFNRDLAGFVQRWNPRFDTVAASNSLSTLYGGSTALRLDGEGASVVPEILAFSVEAGEVATLTVWSYSGGATNLVPEVTTNLITGIWERKPESIVSATNINVFTAQVVFTNDFERLLYVRLVDVSGGTGVPVFRVFGGIAFGDGEAITDWPQGTILGATINEPHTVVTNDGILAFTVTADGSGFPLTNDVSAAGFDLQGVGTLSAQNATISNSASINNDLVVSDRATVGDLRATDSIIASLVVGDLVVTNHQKIYETTTIYLTTNIYATNFVAETYTTNRYTSYISVGTNYFSTNTTYNFVTNEVYTYATVGGWADYSLASWVALPFLLMSNGTATATGAWDFSAATLTGTLDMTGNAITNAGTLTVSNVTLGGVTRTNWPTDSTESDPIYSAWVTNGPGATNAILADGTLVSIDGWGSGGGGGNLTATNTPTAGQMLYASDTTKTNLYFADAPEGGTGGDAATLVVTQMPYLAQALVTGTVVGVYDNANVGFTETLLFGNANSNSFVFEELNGGIVTNLTTLANSTTQGILTASASGTKVTNGCVLRIGGASYGIQALTGGTNVTFLPALNSNTSYAVDSVRGISHTSVALHQGAAGTANGPFVDLATGNKSWNGISVAPDGTTIYATVNGGSIWKSTDSGATWVDLAAGNKNWRGISVAPDGTTIYATVNGGSIWKSTDSGATWVDLAAGNKNWTGISVAPDGTTIYAAVSSGSIWKSVDAGATWVDLAAGNKNWYGISVAPDGTTIYAAVYGGSIWKSTDSGATWVDLAAGTKNWYGISVAPDGTTIYAAVYNGSIWKSTDSGATWVDLAAGNKGWQGISVAPDGTTIYAAVSNGSIWRSEWSAYAPVLGVGHTVATIPMATTTNWRYFNDLYFRDNSNFAGTFYSISWQTNCWSIWSTDSSSWRVVASNDSGAWRWNSNGTFVAQAGLTNNELGTLSYAVQASVSNRMSRADIDGLNDGTYKSAGGFLAGYSPRTAVTFLNRTTNLPPRVYERRVLVDDLRYEQKQANTNDYNLYVPGTNSALTIVTKKVARTCDVVIKYLKDQP